MKLSFYGRYSRIALSLFLILTSLTFSAPSAKAEVNTPPASVDFGNANGSNLTLDQTATLKNGTRPFCDTKSKSVTWIPPQGMTLRNYYRANSPLCKGAAWTSAVIKCVIAQDVFHFYGTKSNPYQGATLTRVYNTDWCINDQIGIRDYLPSPSDALPVNTGEPTSESQLPKGSIYNPKSSASVSSGFNNYQEPYIITDNCDSVATQRYNAADILKTKQSFVGTKLSSGAGVKCYVGVGSPRVKTGQSCVNFQATGDQSIANAIRKNDLTALNLKNLIFQNYSAILSVTGLSGKPITSRYPAAYAAALNNIPYAMPVSSSQQPLDSAEAITAMDNMDCSSVFDFIPVVPASAKDLPEPKMIGTCVVPVYLPARVDKGATGEAYFDFYGSDTRNVEPYNTVAANINVPRYLDAPFASISSTGSNKYARQLSAQEAKAIYASFAAISSDPAGKNGQVAPSSYKANTLGDLVFKDQNVGAYVGTTDLTSGLKEMKTGGHFWPFNNSDTKVSYPVSKNSIQLVFSKSTKPGVYSFSLENMLTGKAKLAGIESLTRENVASSAISAASCSGLEIAPYIFACPTDTAASSSGTALCASPSPTPTTSITPSPTPTKTPTPTPSASSTNPGLVDKSIDNPGGDHNKPCSDPVCVKVTITAPASFTVGGTSRVQSVKVSDVDLICSGHVCNPSTSYENSDPVVSTPIGQISLTGAGGFTPCSSTIAKDCDLAIQSITPPATPIASAKVSAGFYSPTRSTEATKVTLPAASVTVTPKTWQCVRSHIISWPPSFDEEGNMVSPGGSAVVCDQYGWVPNDSLTYTIGSFELRFTDGKGPNRPVSGSIGK